jgi:hypothetical protein
MILTIRQQVIGLLIVLKDSNAKVVHCDYIEEKLLEMLSPKGITFHKKIVDYLLENHGEGEGLGLHPYPDEGDMGCVYHRDSL